MKQAVSITQKNTDKRLRLTLAQRANLGGLLSRQNAASVAKATGRDATEDEMVALYSVLRKVRCAPDELAPYVQRFGGEDRLDVTRMFKDAAVMQFTLDGFEVRLLKAFLSGWLKHEGALGDRDWAGPVLEGCE